MLELLLNLCFTDRKQICIIFESITKQNSVLGHWMKDKLQKWQADNITSPSDAFHVRSAVAKAWE